MHAHQEAAQPITVVSFTPAPRTHGVNGADSIRVTFSAPLAADSPMPSLSPSIPGAWQRVSADTVEFVPAQGFPQLTRVRVVVPAGSAGRPVRHRRAARHAGHRQVLDRRL